jgi:hypothetical protein
MPVRDFRDESGREWRAWDIKPHEISPVTKAEDYLADCYITGWIVFETLSGDEKRRLCPWPVTWKDESEEGLRKLLEMAEVVPPQGTKSKRISGPSMADATANAKMTGKLDGPAGALRQVWRTFRYPGGRFWAVSVVSEPGGGGSPVLRFTAGSRNIDLKKWPEDWAEQPDDALIALLRQASPRRESGTPDRGTPRRRWNDQPQANP